MMCASPPSSLLTHPLALSSSRGNASFLELLKSAVFLESNTGWWDDKIDFDVGYSASGHSTGGRVALMLGALIDNPTKYLVDTKYDSLITAEMRSKYLFVLVRLWLPDLLL